MAIAAITAENVAGGRLAEELVAVSERLRRSTVRVSGREPGGGSGIVWRADGVIVTNAHVARSERATVELWDGRTFAATVTARDPRRDLAALAVEATDLPAAPVRDSGSLRVGELVLAVGNPFGVAGALTAGIIHAIGPAEGRSQERWVQADLRLAPGNSGGPMADARGHVIGVNSMVAGGLALAVPSKAVERFLSRRAQHPHLGVSVQPVQGSLGGATAFGLLVLAVEPGGPAEAAGLMIGDVLVGVGGRPFDDPADLGSALDEAGPGAPLALDVVRGGKRIVCTVALGTADATEAEAA